jgi:hypothetical protein
MRFREYYKEVNESKIDRVAVEKAATKKATQAYGDKTDKTKVKGMVDKAIKLAKDTEDAVAIVLGFFKEGVEEGLRKARKNVKRKKCWSGHKAKGTKMKNGKEVPNCVPINELDEADEFEPHMMYDPKTGKGYKAKKYKDHLRMKKLGYNHEKPDSGSDC